MNYKGIIIQESLNDPLILRELKILATRVEEVKEAKAYGASLGISSYQLDFA